MPNIGPDLPSILGELTIVPPPGSIGLFKKLRRGISRAARGAGRGLKKAGKLAVKIHTAPLKLAAKAGKFALMKAAQLAATPVRLMFRKLAMRRARLLSWRGRKSMSPNSGEKLQAVSWAINAMNRKGPLGKFGVRILKFTKGATLGARLTPVSETGLTGAEIAAAAGAIAGAIATIMKSLNKPGEAPEDPRAGEPAPEAAPAAEAIQQATEQATTEGWFSGDCSILGAELKPHDPPLVDALRVWHACEHAANEQKKAMVKGALGQGKLKKAYRRLKKFTEGGPAIVPPPGASADDMLRAAERYGGYRSKKEAAKARARGDLLGAEKWDLWRYLKTFNRGRGGGTSRRRHRF
jgi:hypothetical protein